MLCNKYTTQQNYFLIHLHSWRRRIREKFCQSNFATDWMIYFVNSRKRCLCVTMQNYVPLLEIFFSFILKKTHSKPWTPPPTPNVQMFSLKRVNSIPRLTRTDKSVSSVFNADAVFLYKIWINHVNSSIHCTAAEVRRVTVFLQVRGWEIHYFFPKVSLLLRSYKKNVIYGRLLSWLTETKLLLTSIRYLIRWFVLEMKYEDAVTFAHIKIQSNSRGRK